METQDTMDVAPAPTETAPNPATAAPDQEAVARIVMWRGNLSRAKQFLRDVVPDWAINIDYRRGKPFDSDSDRDRIAVPLDWAATKAKQSQLFSQVPEIRLQARYAAYKASTQMFAKKVNEGLTDARVGVAMDEELPDCINAAGVGAVLVAMDSLSEDRDVPTVGPEIAAAMKAKGMTVPTQKRNVPTDTRFTVTRISPSDLLWEVSFTGSDFDDSPWLGNKGRTTWVGARGMFPKLTDDDKAKVCGADTRNTLDSLAAQSDDRRRQKPNDTVEYEQVFYKRYLFHAEETDFCALHRLVFLKGMNDPIVDEPWTGQERNEQGRILGVRKFPIRVLTLTYISDESIPPSDTAMGRPMVDELNRSRGQMIRNRESSTPLRWMNTNLVDPQVQVQMMRGTWQGTIPINGDGSRALGEVARANFPNEDFTFDNIAKADFRETWQVEDAVGIGPQIRSAAEANNRQQNYQTRIGYERARCAKHFVGIAEVMAGLIALRGTFSPEELQVLGNMDPKLLSDCYAFNVRADSTLLLDSTQRIERLMTFLNMTAKSGCVDVVAVISEIAELNGLPPETVHKMPEKGPEPMSASLRLSGATDMNDVMTLAMLAHSNQLPTPEDVNAAKMVLASLPQQPQVMPPNPGGPGGPDGPPPPDGPPSAGGGRPQNQPPSLQSNGQAPAAAQQTGPQQTGRPQAPYAAHPNWDAASRVEKRSDDGK